MVTMYQHTVHELTYIHVSNFISSGGGTLPEQRCAGCSLRLL